MIVVVHAEGQHGLHGLERLPVPTQPLERGAPASMRLSLRLPSLGERLLVRVNLLERLVELRERHVVGLLLEVALGGLELDDDSVHRGDLLVGALTGALLDEPLRGDGHVGSHARLAHLPSQFGVHLEQRRVELGDLLALLARLVAAHERPDKADGLAQDERRDQVLVVNLQAGELDGEVLSEDLVWFGELCNSKEVDTAVSHAAKVRVGWEEVSLFGFQAGIEREARAHPSEGSSGVRSRGRAG